MRSSFSFPVARMLLVVIPFVTSSNALVSRFWFLVVRPAATSSVLAPSSDALCS